VDPGLAPANPVSEDATPLVDWVVEDAAAPQPESEPAWMILRRMEAKLDEQREATLPHRAIPSSRAKAEPTLFAAEPMSQLAQRLQHDPLMPPAELFRPSPKSLDPLSELETAMAAAEMKLLQPGDDAERPVAAPVPMQQPAAVAKMEHTLPAEGDADDFLFAPEKTRQEPATRKAAAEEPAPVTPETTPPPQADAEERKNESRAAYDPLAPLRAMSDAEKIALFS
jgi:hypothetical protein